MRTLNFGEIVLLKFPFTDGKAFKKRPAFVIYDSNDDDIIVCRITSKIYNTEKDIYINNWEKSGLKLPSVIRDHKIATLEKAMVDLIIGEIDEQIKSGVKLIFSNLISNK